MSTLLQDLRFGLRMLARSPGFTAVAVLSLALGIGANSTIFSIVDTLFLRPWPVKDPARLAQITTHQPKESDFSFASYPDYLDIRQQVSAFADVVAYGGRGGFISIAGQQGKEVSTEVVSQNYFAALDVKPLRGRTFSPQSGQAGSESHSVVVSYPLWQRYFGGDPSLPGKTVLLDGREFTVIAITPQNFGGLRSGWTPDTWVTKEGWETMVPGENRYDNARDNRWFELAGYVRPGAQLSEARAQLDTLAQRLALAFPASNQGVRFSAAPAFQVGGQEVQMSVYLMAMVGLVLLISCANVAVLTLAQMERRRREMAMRQALGAGRARLAGQLLSEGLLLSVAGGALGILLAWWLMRLLPTLVSGFPDVYLAIDGRVLLFTAAISLLTVLMFGLAPGIRAGKSDVVTVLKGEDPRYGQGGGLALRNLLGSTEVALSVVLLAGSTLLLRSLLYSQQINPGFDTKKNTLALSVAPPTLYGYSNARAAAFYPALAARLEAVPGVVRSSYARRMPLTEEEGGETEPVVIPGAQPPPGTDHFKIRYNTVSPKFFSTVGARLLRGRDFNQFDLPSSPPVVIVNDTMAQRFWPGQDPVGKSIQVWKKNRQIVGVVEAGRYVNLHEAPQPYLFLPFTQEFSFEGMMFVETAGDPQNLVHEILGAATAFDKNLPIVDAVTFRDYMRTVLGEERSLATLLAALSILGMFLAAVGLYAAVAYRVGRRTHEIGVRMALGARRADVLGLVLAEGLRSSVAGALVGLAGAFAASRLLAQFIYGVTATDPWSYTAGVLIAVGVALLASYVPARRAMTVDPLVALKCE
jgi:predicted permease